MMFQFELKLFMSYHFKQTQAMETQFELKQFLICNFHLKQIKSYRF